MVSNPMPDIVLSGPKFQHVQGRYSSLSISLPAGLAVSAVDHVGSLYYSVGNYDGDHRIDWGENSWYGRGRSPSVCLVYEGETLYVI